MRAVLAFLIALAAPSALAAEGTRDLVPTTKDLTSTTKDLVAETRDLVATTEDLITVKEAPKEITIELSGDILFDFDKADIRPQAVPALAAAAELIRTGAKGTVRINGHTDAKGSAAHNQKLSLARATSVRDWLVAKGDVGKIKFALKGFGATKPVAPNTRPDGSDDPVGRQLNRRVEIIFARK
ncbi:MAG TPA: OmpA family protein [Bauldia sp.]|nr:OmpA family protein [Bauldia sp.]